LLPRFQGPSAHALEIAALGSPTGVTWLLEQDFRRLQQTIFGGELARDMKGSQEPQYFRGRDAEDYVLARW
jgi:hypothetical protein